MTMQDVIKEKLREIEQTENVRILHAVESGSRAWGFPSMDSDYDVRFIYVRPLEYYLKLETTRDVIELPINDVLDINGWDLKKAMQLLYRTNPTLLDWLASPVVYRETCFADMFRPFLYRYFSSRKAVCHYLRMAERNYRIYLEGETARVKKYFYVLRPVLACLWILQKLTPPPMSFSELMASQLEPEIRPLVDKLIDLKMNSPEIQDIPREGAIHEYLNRCIAEIKEKQEHVELTEHTGWEPLNELFREIVMTN